MSWIGDGKGREAPGRGKKKKGFRLEAHEKNILVESFSID